MDLLKAIRSIKLPDPDAKINGLLTPWGQKIDSQNVLQEHPHPQFERESFVNLNGGWDYAFEGVHADATSSSASICCAQPACDASESPTDFAGIILVPFSPESLLSGVQRQLKPDERLWYRRTFDTPEIPAGQRCILHFEAVDHACSCFVNGTLVGTHEGGYLPFWFDITDAIADVREAANELVVCVVDPSDMGQQPRGKQKLQSGGIFYTATSGIWQTVWMEVVPAARLLSVRMHAELSTGTLTVDAKMTGADVADSAMTDATTDVKVAGVKDCDLIAKVIDPETGDVVASGRGRLSVGGDGRERSGGKGEVPAGRRQEAHVELQVPHPHAWNPGDPHLYTVVLEYGEDVVKSYCAFRDIAVREDADGVMRFYLNGEVLFLEGVLDQGYWSDGMLTAPSDEALVWDIEQARNLGFNMIRKHAKVESDRWYYHCDRLGMIVWQDMVNGGGAYSSWWTNFRPTLFHFTWTHFSDRHHRLLGSGDAESKRKWLDHTLDTIDYLGNHPCICTWVAFNEGWGQHDTEAVVARMREADPTRSIDEASGWYDQGGGDFKSIHNYFRRYTVERDRHHRAVVISEFGGFAYYAADHSALDHAYGYETYRSLDELQTAVDAARHEVKSLADKGLVGSVYTQLSDIEEEDNGLVSYDRRIVKLSRHGRRPEPSA